MTVTYLTDEEKIKALRDDLQSIFKQEYENKSSSLKDRLQNVYRAYWRTNKNPLAVFIANPNKPLAQTTLVFAHSESDARDVFADINSRRATVCRLTYIPKGRYILKTQRLDPKLESIIIPLVNVEELESTVIVTSNIQGEIVQHSIQRSIRKKSDLSESFIHRTMSEPSSKIIFGTQINYDTTVPDVIVDSNSTDKINDDLLDDIHGSSEEVHQKMSPEKKIRVEKIDDDSLNEIHQGKTSEKEIKKLPQGQDKIHEKKSPTDRDEMKITESFTEFECDFEDKVHEKKSPTDRDEMKITESFTEFECGFEVESEAYKPVTEYDFISQIQSSTTLATPNYMDDKSIDGEVKDDTNIMAPGTSRVHIEDEGNDLAKLKYKGGCAFWIDYKEFRKSYGCDKDLIEMKNQFLPSSAIGTDFIDILTNTLQFSIGPKYSNFIGPAVSNDLKIYYKKMKESNLNESSHHFIKNIKPASKTSSIMIWQTPNHY